jgi:biopolymer transport protein ExbB
MFKGRNVWMWLVLGAIVGFALTGGLDQVLAGEATPESGKTEKTTSLFDMWMQGGIIGMFICVVSVVSLALTIQYFFQFKPEILMPPHILTEVEGLFEEGNYEDAMTMLEADQSFLGRVVGAGIAKVDSGYDAMKEAADNKFNEEAQKIRGKVSWLATIAATATQLGLFGTVVGMVITFNKISQSEGMAKPAELAFGIGMALVTTVEGLAVAMPTLVFTNFFRNKAEDLFNQVGTVVYDLLDGFKGGAGAGGEEEEETA